MVGAKMLWKTFNFRGKTSFITSSCLNSMWGRRFHLWRTSFSIRRNGAGHGGIGRCQSLIYSILWRQAPFRTRNWFFSESKVPNPKLLPTLHRRSKQTNHFKNNLSTTITTLTTHVMAWELRSPRIPFLNWWIHRRIPCSIRRNHCWHWYES